MVVRNLSWIILFPLAVVLIVFAVSNRGPIAINLWPVPVSVEIPLFILLFAVLTIGVVWGGVATWMSGGNARKIARAKVREARSSEMEIKRLKSQVSKLEADAKSREVGITLAQTARLSTAQKNSPRLPPPADAA